MDTGRDLTQLVKACKRASRRIARLNTAQKNSLLGRMARLLTAEQDAIIAANAKDLAHAKSKGLSPAMTDRLVLNEKRVEGMAQAIDEIIALDDPVDKITSMWKRPNGIEVGRRRIPLGVIAMIYESRPNVTIDAAALCLKAGNAAVLRGGSEAFHSNRALAKVIERALTEEGLPSEAVTLVPTTDRAAMNELMKMDEDIDLIIPRGGEGLIRFVAQHSRIPVIKHYKGVCHLYVDQSADLDTAINLFVDGKTSRPGVCNALETVLVNRDVSAPFFGQLRAILSDHGVAVRGCPETCALLPAATAVKDEDYHAEFLDLIIAARVVADLDEAIAHIDQYGSNHTEVIVTNHLERARRFVRDVDASVVMVNASSRFSDGGQLGLGAEIGISTTKLHSYGPMGLDALTTEKFFISGNGQVRHDSSRVT